VTEGDHGVRGVRPEAQDADGGVAEVSGQAVDAQRQPAARDQAAKPTHANERDFDGRPSVEDDQLLATLRAMYPHRDYGTVMDAPRPPRKNPVAPDDAGGSG
jgi:hypothetical protein